MRNHNRTFTVVELGNNVSARNIRLPANETVEVVDLTTRAVLHVKVADVSIYRHTLHMHGKNFNITNVMDSL